MYVTPKHTCSEKHELKTIGLTRAQEVCRPLGPKVDHHPGVSDANDYRWCSQLNRDEGLRPWEQQLGKRWHQSLVSSATSQGARPFSWGLTTPFPQTSMGALILTPQLLPATCSLWGYGRQPVSLLQLHL